MAFYEVSPADGGRAKLVRAVELVCFALVVAHLVYLTTAYLDGIWLEAPDGNGLPTDFVNVWEPASLALAGHAAAAYDWPTHKLAEESAVGHAFDGYFGLALSADFPVRRRRPVTAALCDRQRGLGLRHIPCLCHGDPRHHRRPHRFSPCRRISLPYRRVSSSGRTDSSAPVLSAARSFSSIGDRSWRACCLGCSPTNRISA